MTHSFIALFVGIVFGVLGAFWTFRLNSRRIIAQAQSLADEQIQLSQSEADADLNELKEAHEEEKEKAFEQFEKDHLKTREKLLEMEVRLEERKDQLEESYLAREQEFEKRDHIHRSRAGQIKGREEKVLALKNQFTDLLRQYQDRLLSLAQLNLDEVKQQIRSDLESETRLKVNKHVQAFTEEAEADLEREAKWQIQTALARFPRPYCAERGIGNVNFTSLEAMERVFGPNRSFLQEVEKTCGVDISVHDQYQSASILGYDPVRREWGRLTLEKMISERNLNSERIQKIAENMKRELFKRIIRDGNRLAKELRVEGLAEEVRHMMGALRYRYSFAQNQHFHCAEVGFLCGLLSSEFQIPIKDGRRAGLLHDIGKSMDHSKDGGHAVIGADFIQKHGEAPHIVHAVRAHHYDETPSSDLAYLVIAADAISGARPGARRSTADSYSQKIEDLQNISNSFPGVIATYIMSAGREVRVVVNSQQVDDHKALELSKQIARKIEEECSYPGLIKLTVVRETHAFELAR